MLKKAKGAKDNNLAEDKNIYRPQNYNSEIIDYDRRQGERRIRADRRANVKRVAFPASLMAQMIIDHQRLKDNPCFMRQPINEQINIYQQVKNTQTRRMPAGYAQQEIV